VQESINSVGLYHNGPQFCVRFALYSKTETKSSAVARVGRPDEVRRCPKRLKT